MNCSIPKQIIEQIANNYGTPTYVYHAETIEGRYTKMTNAFANHPTKLFYACKALSNINILTYIKDLGAGLDCVSINEVKLGLKVGFLPNQIIFTPNCVSFEEIVAATKFGVHINIDNISMLERFGNEFGETYPILIRFNPHIEAGGNYKISTGHIDSKFGISIHQIRHVLRIVQRTNLKVEGLHMHTGSEIKDTEVFLQALDIMFEMANNFPDLKYLDLGSGFKVPYQEGDLETNIEELGTKLAVAVKAFETIYGNPLEIWFEPGKYLVSECGYLITKVNVVKPTTATVFAGIDSGFNHLIRPMFYDSYHHIVNASHPEGNARIYTIVGNICETDTFAWDRVLPEIREGDLLVFCNAGAYGFEMSSTFNSRFKPAEVMYLNDEVSLIRRRTTFEDLFADQILLSSVTSN